MKYCLDTNALIEICKTDDNLIRFFQKVIPSKDEFYIPSYVVDEFEIGLEANPDQACRFNLLSLLICVNVAQEHFFTLDQSLLDGIDVLASGSSGFPQLKYSLDDYKKSGSTKSYDVWRRRILNDHLIAEMSDGQRCDGIITANKIDFEKIDNSLEFNIISFEEYFHQSGSLNETEIK